MISEITYQQRSGKNERTMWIIRSRDFQTEAVLQIQGPVMDQLASMSRKGAEDEIGESSGTL